MSNSKVRHLLNNLSSLKGTNYLEIGVWKGSTWISSLYNNSSTINSAIAIDNWTEFKGPRHDFINNCSTFINQAKYDLIEHDCFLVDLNLFKNPINLYFYDGNHTAVAQERAFTYFNSVFNDTFIAIIDDWNHPPVPIGTRNAFISLGYEILYEVILNSKDHWWNGLYAAVIQKKTYILNNP